MMREKFGLLLIFLGLLATVVIYFFLQNRYESQSSWIKADVTLDSISYLDPIYPDSYRSRTYYGVYYFNIDGDDVRLCSPDVALPEGVKNQVVFYINPNNYDDYHVEYTKNTKYLALIALLLSFLGVIDLIIEKKNNDITKMFINCDTSTLDVSNFDTSNVTNMEGMFDGCDNLADLDLSDFDTSNINTKD